MNRRVMREHVFKQLFLIEFYKSDDEFAEQCELYRQDLEDVDAAELTELGAKAAAVAANIPVIDEKINSAAQGWKTSRMNKVDLTLIRLAVYEMEKDDQVPVRVAINEAVELAKEYGGDDSPSFVNAILGKIAKGLEE